MLKKINKTGFLSSSPIYREKSYILLLSLQSDKMNQRGRLGTRTINAL
jgi:hypothetical protein